MKIKVLVHILCNLSTSYCITEIFIWIEENTSHKTENVFALFFKNCRTQLSVFCHMKKANEWCFSHIGTNIYIYLACVSSLNWNYLNMWWFAKFNVHFSNSAEFITQFHFDECLLFLLTFVPHYCDFLLWDTI